MKVLMTTDAVGGVWTYALDLCAGLREHDIDVVLATMGPRPSAEQRAAAKSISNLQLVESDFRLEWMQDPWADVVAAGEWLLGLAAAHDVDLVHLNGYTHAALSWNRPVICVAHSCVMTWWQAVHGAQPPAEWDLYRLNVTRGLHAADMVVAPTRSFLAELSRCYPFGAPAHVIHNARALVSRGDEPEGGGSIPIVLACGRAWDASKNMQVFDAASQGAFWDGYVIGNPTGPDGQSFAPTSVKCLGPLPANQVEHWLGRADVFVHPALYEPFGLAVLEAAAADTVLVLADIASLRELWNGAAEFFDPRDSQSLRDVIRCLFAHPTRMQALKAAARRRATHFRVDAMAEEYSQLYRDLVRPHELARAAERLVVPGQGVLELRRQLIDEGQVA